MAQESTYVDTFKRSVGIDATFVNNFLPFDNTIGERGDYLVHYFKFRENGKFTRHAFDIDVFGRFENNESEEDIDDARFNIDYKISFGKRKRIFKNGYIYYGTEMRFDYFLDQRVNRDFNAPDENSFNTNLDQIIEFMYGPMLGIEYKFSPRVSVYTEAGFYIMGRFMVEKFRSDNNPALDFTDTTIQVQDVFDLPGSIILFYSF